MTVFYFNFCAKLLWLFLQEPFRDLGTVAWHYCDCLCKSHLEILAPALGINIGIAKFLFFPYNFYSEKNEHICPIHLSIFSCALLGTSITLLQSNFQFIHPEASISVLEKRLLEFLELPVHKCFEKIAALNIFGNFPVKHPCCRPF